MDKDGLPTMSDVDVRSISNASRISKMPRNVSLFKSLVGTEYEQDVIEEEQHSKLTDL